MKPKTLKQLNQNPWLLTIPEPERMKLIESVRVRNIPKGQRIQRKGEPADGLFGVLEGEVQIGATTFTGTEIAFTRLKPGFWFGEIALLDGGKRTHDAHASKATTLAILPKGALLPLSEENPRIYQALVRLLCEHCRQAFAAIDQFLFLSPEQRLAQRLLNLMTARTELQIMLSQQELGDLIGVSRQSTNKILKRWEKAGWIHRSYRCIEICDVEELERLAIFL